MLASIVFVLAFLVIFSVAMRIKLGKDWDRTLQRMPRSERREHSNSIIRLFFLSAVVALLLAAIVDLV